MKTMALTLLILLATACTNIKEPQPEPVSIVKPSAGNVSIYIFRPELDLIQKQDAPNLFINGTLVCQLPYSSYTRVEVSSGKHSIKLNAKKAESQIWNTEAVIELTKDEIYFIAVWNSNQPRKIAANVPIVLPGLVGFWPILGPKSGSDPGASFEVVDRTTGEYSIAGLRHIPSN